MLPSPFGSRKFPTALILAMALPRSCAFGRGILAMHMFGVWLGSNRIRERSGLDMKYECIGRDKAPQLHAWL